MLRGWADTKEAVGTSTAVRLPVIQERLGFPQDYFARSRRELRFERLVTVRAAFWRGLRESDEDRLPDTGRLG